MADRYTGVISILKRDIEKYPDVKDVVNDLFYNYNGKLYDNDMWEEDSTVATFKDVEARYGMFEDLEDILMELEVPFDRWSDAYCEYDSEQVYYRPDIDKAKLFYANRDGKFEFTKEELSKLVNGLDLNTTVGLTELGKRFKEKLDSVPAIPPLETYETK